MLRTLTRTDRLLDSVQNALETVFGAPRAERPNPGACEPDVVLDEGERRHAAGLMRINHVGEVCAQALYVGQAAVARDPVTRAHLLDLPAADQRSRAILAVMKDDEARHAANAEAAGARRLPPPIPSLMAAASRLMKAVAYRV